MPTPTPSRGAATARLKLPLHEAVEVFEAESDYYMDIWVDYSGRVVTKLESRTLFN